MKLRTGDKVTVIAGADKGKTGKVLKVLEDKVIVEGVRIVKKHIKPKNNGGTGEITTKQFDYDSYYGVSPKEMIAWLEKQGEKPTNKIEVPDFKEQNKEYIQLED